MRETASTALAGQVIDETEINLKHNARIVGQSLCRDTHVLFNCHVINAAQETTRYGGRIDAADEVTRPASPWSP